MKVAASPQKKEANPASLHSAAPSKGRGSRGHSLLPMEGGTPKGRRLEGESGMKKSGKDRLKSTIYESTLSTADAVPLPQWGRQISSGYAAILADDIPFSSAFPSRGRLFLLSGEAATFIPNSSFNSLPVSLHRAAGFQGR